MRSSGFSLIELLVVIAIITILAGIVLPVYLATKEKARQSSCSFNLKQLAAAMQTYAEDYKDRLPGMAYYDPVQAKAQWVWAVGQISAANPVDVEKGALFPYVKNAGIYRCPSDRYGGLKKLSYSMSSRCDRERIGQMKRPSRAVLLVDQGFTLDDGCFRVQWDSQNDRFHPQSLEMPSLIHHNATNVAFIDGHAKLMRLSDFHTDNWVIR